MIYGLLMILESLSDSGTRRTMGAMCLLLLLAATLTPHCTTAVRTDSHGIPKVIYTYRRDGWVDPPAQATRALRALAADNPQPTLILPQSATTMIPMATTTMTVAAQQAEGMFPVCTGSCSQQGRAMLSPQLAMHPQSHSSSAKGQNQC